jgi:hypothetical protein
MSVSPSVPDALIRCVSSGLAATDREIHALARRIWAETAPYRSAFAWDRLDDASLGRRAALRTAIMALNGCGTAV